MKIKTIDFKSFYAGGSPEYIRAKKIVVECGLPKISESKIGPTKLLENAKSRSQKYELNAKLRSVKAYSLYINPLAFFDVNFMIIAGSVVLVAVLEKAIAHSGMISIASAISSVLIIAFPVVAIGSIIYLIGHSPIFF